jgi:hypothetical protein
MFKPLPDISPWPRRRHRNWDGSVSIITLITAAALWFAWLDSQVLGPGRAVEVEDPSGCGISVRSEVIHLWLPQSSIELARRSRSVIETHQELRAALERRGQENLWYARTIRSHQLDGGVAVITYVTYPYREPEHFQELVEILARAAGDLGSHSASRDSAAEIHILPGNLVQRPPREVVKELLAAPRRPGTRQSAE